MDPMPQESLSLINLEQISAEPLLSIGAVPKRCQAFFCLHARMPIYLDPCDISTGSACRLGIEGLPKNACCKEQRNLLDFEGSLCFWANRGLSYSSYSFFEDKTAHQFSTEICYRGLSCSSYSIFEDKTAQFSTGICLTDAALFRSACCNACSLPLGAHVLPRMRSEVLRVVPPTKRARQCEATRLNPLKALSRLERES